MSTKERFQKTIDSLFQHLGMDAIYQPVAGETRAIRIIPRRPEDLYELGEGRLHGENPRFDIRVNEVTEPQIGDDMVIENKTYRIEEEPRFEQHHLVWTVQTLPVI